MAREKVPEVLLSGNQKHIDAWKKEQSILRTKERRPDLYARYVRLQECRQLLMKQKLLHIDMIELINRGRAQLLYFGQGQILLKDMEYEIYFMHVLIRQDFRISVHGRFRLKKYRWRFCIRRK